MTTADFESRIRAIMAGSWFSFTVLSGGVTVSGRLKNYGGCFCMTFDSLAEAVEKLESINAEKDDTVYDEPA